MSTAEAGILYAAIVFGVPALVFWGPGVIRKITPTGD